MRSSNRGDCEPDCRFIHYHRGAKDPKGWHRKDERSDLSDARLVGSEAALMATWSTPLQGMVEMTRGPYVRISSRPA
jgi:hypothetical protein